MSKELKTINFLSTANCIRSRELGTSQTQTCLKKASKHGGTSLVGRRALVFGHALIDQRGRHGKLGCGRESIYALVLIWRVATFFCRCCIWCFRRLLCISVGMVTIETSRLERNVWCLITDVVFYRRVLHLL